jgi:hypothetical protein
VQFSKTDANKQDSINRIIFCYFRTKKMLIYHISDVYVLPLTKLGVCLSIANGRHAIKQILAMDRWCRFRDLTQDGNNG